MIRFRVVHLPHFTEAIRKRCAGLARFDEYLKALEWELQRDPRLFADQLSPEWPRFARFLGDADCGWRCLVQWRVEEEQVVLEDIYPVDGVG